MQAIAAIPLEVIRFPQQNKVFTVSFPDPRVFIAALGCQGAFDSPSWLHYATSEGEDLQAGQGFDGGTKGARVIK